MAVLLKLHDVTATSALASLLEDWKRNNENELNLLHLGVV